jgi:serine/threonine-protein kinase
MDQPGCILNDRYRLVERAGRGGMAHVWRAVELRGPHRGRTVAIKRILPSLAGNADMARMFLDEARMLATFEHPNIVRFVDYGCCTSGPYLAVEWVDGADAQQLSGDRTLPLPQEAVIPLACDLLAALAVTHRGLVSDGRLSRMPVIHRDISLSNLLVSVDGVCKLADFGLARSLAHPRTHRRGTARGKISYLPPEVLRGAPHGVRGDLYSVGVVMWEMLAGEPVFAELTDARERARALAFRARPSIRTVRADVAPRLAALIDATLSIDPARRASSASALRGALLEVFDAEWIDAGRACLADDARRHRDEAGGPISHDVERVAVSMHDRETGPAAAAV